MLRIIKHRFFHSHILCLLAGELHDSMNTRLSFCRLCSTGYDPKFALQFVRRQQYKMHYTQRIMHTLNIFVCFAVVPMDSHILQNHTIGPVHDDVIKWKHFPRWPFVRGIHRSPVNSPHKGQWRGALMFSLICARIKDWVNNGEAGDLRRYRAHYDVLVMAYEVIMTNESDDSAINYGMTKIKLSMTIAYLMGYIPYFRWYYCLSVCLVGLPSKFSESKPVV